ncbi:MAG TPA: (d)CMP kinase [Candidatus Dormibacteraeota bacterium]|nr:(d)CMP kinase [Candidatus Dormibacteraeota bacterium]
MIVAIDGPAGSGKSAVGRRVAAALGLPFIDSGLLYRAVGARALESGIDLDDADALTELAASIRVEVDGETVRIDGQDYTGKVHQPELSVAASRVARVPGVRRAVVDQLRAMASGDVVMAGRDIGTVVFPEAEHKFYLTASLEERARRRVAQLAARGERPDAEALEAEIEERDRRDSQRAVAPMRPAGDAVVLDTEGLDLEAVVRRVLEQVRRRGGPPDPAEPTARPPATGGILAPRRPRDLPVHDPGRPVPELYGLMRFLVRLLARVYLAGGLLHVSGLEHVPRSGPLVVCANHTSTVDPPLVPAFLPRPDSWSMAKAELLARPGFGAWVLRHYHAFPVIRHTPDRRALRRAAEILRAGGVLVLYPEGTRVGSGGLREAEPGAGFIARTTGVPVLPVTLTGTRECFPKGSWLPRRVRVEIRYGPPLRIRERRPDGRRVENQEAADAIMLAIAEQLPPDARGAYADLVSLRERLRGVWEPVSRPPAAAGDRG